MGERNNREIRSRNFRLSLIDDQSHRRLASVRFSRAGIIVIVVSTLVVLLTGAFLLIGFTPLRTFIPGYPDGKTKRTAVQNAIRIDSLEREILQWELYTENLRRVVSGEEPIRLDSLVRTASAGKDAGAGGERLQARDSLLREEVRKEERFGLSGTGRRLPIEGMHFFVPLKGVISQPYDRALHPSIDITAPANSVVMSVLDGTVIFSGWDEDTGYTIQVQHDGDLISIYRHNQKLLKKTGDPVRAGMPIALVGNSGSLTTGDHLHFELWYKGEAVDPARYINF